MIIGEPLFTAWQHVELVLYYEVGFHCSDIRITGDLKRLHWFTGIFS